MVAITASMWSSAILRPSSTWARRRARSSSNSVRRVMTSCRWLMYSCSARFSVSDRGWVPRSIRASMLTPKLDCSCGVLEEIVEHFHRLRIALQLDDGSHPGAIGLVAEIADAVELALADLFGDPLQERSLVDLVWQLGDDDLVAAAAGRFLDEGLGADHDASAPGGIGRLDPFPAEDRSAGREVRAGDDLHQVLDRGLGIVDQQTKSRRKAR